MKLIISAFLIAISTITEASDSKNIYSVLGIGTSSCASYVNSHKNNYERLQYSAWASGFITSFNRLTDDLNDISENVDETARQEWLYKYCKVNTLDTYDRAVQKLIEELIRRRK